VNLQEKRERLEILALRCGISNGWKNGFRSFRPIAEFANPGLLLVCRLDAPNAETVRRMIVDAIATEKNGLWGRAYVDGANKTVSAGATGDEWLAEIVGQLHKVGVPVVYENTPALFPEAYPMTDCALYYGWYAGKVTGPFTHPDFRFVPGAIAVHIHSFSGSTLRDPNATWVAPLVTKGAAASLGNVYEPYLQLTSRLDTFNDRLLHGFTFAESAYMSVQTLSWQSVMVGDPLYRPYAAWLDLAEKAEAQKAASDWSAYHDFAVKHSSLPPAGYRAAAKQFAARTHNAPMLEDIGLLEAGGELHRRHRCFDLARTTYEARRCCLVLRGGRLCETDKPKRGVDLFGRASDCPQRAGFGVIEEKRRWSAHETAAPPLAPVIYGAFCGSSEPRRRRGPRSRSKIHNFDRHIRLYALRASQLLGDRFCD
jgi:hypothetical protein